MPAVQQEEEEEALQPEVLPTAKNRQLVLTTPEINKALAPIRAIHRHLDGVIPFHLKDPSNPGNLLNHSAVSGHYLHNRLFTPQWLVDLAKDAYFGLQAMYCIGNPEKHYKLDFPRLDTMYGSKSVRRRSEYLRYLNTAYVDVDCHKTKFSVGEVVGYMKDLVAAGELPQPSLFIFSGRGVWFLWLLHDRQAPGQSVRTTAESLVPRWKRCQKRLLKLFDLYNSDASAATDLARIARIPGSLNTKANKPAVYRCGARDELGRPMSYSIEELERHLGVAADPTMRADRPAFKNAPRANQVRGMLVNRANWIEYLEAGRDGFREGCRHHALTVYAQTLKQLGNPWDVVEKKVTHMAASCRPTFSRPELRSVFTSLKKRKKPLKWGNDKLTAILLITSAEKEELRQECNVTFDGNAPDKPTGKMQQRLDALQSIVDELGHAPSGREAVELMAAKGFAVKSNKTIHNYYDKLGIVTGREKAPPKKPVRMGNVFDLPAVPAEQLAKITARQLPLLRALHRRGMDVDQIAAKAALEPAAIRHVIDNPGWQPVSRAA